MKQGFPFLDDMILRKTYPDFSILADGFVLLTHKKYKDGTIKTFSEEEEIKKDNCSFKFSTLKYVLSDGKVLHVTLHNYYLTDDIRAICEAEEHLKEPHVIQEAIFSDPMCKLIEALDSE